MKKVIKQEKTVDTNNLSKTMIYAYMYGDNLFILIGIHGECRYTFKNANGITDNVTVGSKETLKECIEAAIDRGNNVYQFKHFTECIEWYLKETK